MIEQDTTFLPTERIIIESCRVHMRIITMKFFFDLGAFAVILSRQWSFF